MLNYKIVLCDLDVSTLIEARESDRSDCAHLELLVEETLEDELSESLSVGSGVEEIAEDHVLDELDGCSSCMPLGTGADLLRRRSCEKDGREWKHWPVRVVRSSLQDGVDENRSLQHTYGWSLSSCEWIHHWLRYSLIHKTEQQRAGKSWLVDAERTYGNIRMTASFIGCRFRVTRLVCNWITMAIGMSSRNQTNKILPVSIKFKALRASGSISTTCPETLARNNNNRFAGDPSLLILST